MKCVDGLFNFDSDDFDIVEMKIVRVLCFLKVVKIV